MFLVHSSCWYACFFFGREDNNITHSVRAHILTFEFFIWSAGNFAAVYALMITSAILLYVCACCMFVILLRFLCLQRTIAAETLLCLFGHIDAQSCQSIAFQVWYLTLCLDCCLVNNWWRASDAARIWQLSTDSCKLVCCCVMADVSSCNRRQVRTVKVIFLGWCCCARQAYPGL